MSSDSSISLLLLILCSLVPGIIYTMWLSSNEAQNRGKSFREFTFRYSKTVVREAVTRTAAKLGRKIYNRTPTLIRLSLPMGWSWGEWVDITTKELAPDVTAVKINCMQKFGATQRTRNDKIVNEFARELTKVLPNYSDGIAKAGIGVADEIAKLKALLDTGAITQQEFDNQKAKLLQQ